MVSVLIFGTKFLHKKRKQSKMILTKPCHWVIVKKNLIKLTTLHAFSHFFFWSEQKRELTNLDHDLTFQKFNLLKINVTFFHVDWKAFEKKINFHKANHFPSSLHPFQIWRWIKNESKKWAVQWLLDYQKDFFVFC